jgi:hypothetical protein
VAPLPKPKLKPTLKPSKLLTPRPTLKAVPKPPPAPTAPPKAQSKAPRRVFDKSDTIRLGYRFNRVNRAAVSWARLRAGWLVAEVTKTIREAIREVIGDLLEGETTWEDATDDLADVFQDEQRAKVIAHTETMAAANEGQKQLWGQAVTDGYLNGGERMVWIVTPDDRLCPICEGQEDTMVPLGQQFPSGGPPAHPRCRCTTGLVP